MIRNSFVFLDGVGYKTEERLWKGGILSWEDFLNESGISGISSNQKRRHDSELEKAQYCVKNKITEYFSKRLKARDYWRLYPSFKEKACFLDIETTGLNSNSDITVVGVFDGNETKSFVKGFNLNEETLRNELSKYSMLLTFYGSAFDVPFIRRKFPGIPFTTPHLDLCFASRRIGLKGGLKRIERELGINRDDGVSEIDGLEAVRLWRKWERDGSKDALEKLIEYNRADVVNLMFLADTVYERLKDKTFTTRCS
jgi:uncharacterized protein YprB with RNaseH-like and TPR domain